MKTISMIDYNMGNLLSVQKAFESVGAKLKMVGTADEIREAEVLVLPGVGNFGDGMEHLVSMGLAEAIREKVAAGTPIMGICLGEQLLFDSSEEAPGVDGLGIIPGKVIKFDLEDKTLKVPHMGWNSVSIKQETPLLTDVENEDYYYFVHSFYACPEDPAVTALSCTYGIEFCAAVATDKVFATQFHPEKSQDKGLTLIKNFISKFC